MTTINPRPPAGQSFLQAVARMEGFYADGTRPNRNNNPGDIEWGRVAQAHGATHGDPRFAVFPTAAAGFACMQALFATAYRGMSVAAAIAKWAPPVENDTARYVRCVCDWTGLAPDAIIDAHLMPAEAA